MTIYSLYIYDRHCNCVYYQDWHRTSRPRTALEGGLLPGVSAALYPKPEDPTSDASIRYSTPSGTLNSATGVIVAVNEDAPRTPLPPARLNSPPPQAQQPPSATLTFDEEAKLVYGVVLSLRNMVKKLSGRDEQFVNYTTSTYKMHLYETLSGYKFVVLSDPKADSLRFVLRQIYAGPFLEYVVRNPLVPMDSRARGIDNEFFRTSTDRMIRALTVFE